MIRDIVKIRENFNNANQFPFLSIKKNILFIFPRKDVKKLYAND